MQKPDRGPRSEKTEFYFQFSGNKRKHVAPTLAVAFDLAKKALVGTTMTSVPPKPTVPDSTGTQ